MTSSSRARPFSGAGSALVRLYGRTSGMRIAGQRLRLGRRVRTFAVEAREELQRVHDVGHELAAERRRLRRRAASALKSFLSAFGLKTVLIAGPAHLVAALPGRPVLVARGRPDADRVRELRVRGSTGRSRWCSGRRRSRSGSVAEPVIADGRAGRQQRGRADEPGQVEEEWIGADAGPGLDVLRPVASLALPLVLPSATGLPGPLRETAAAPVYIRMWYGWLPCRPGR